MPSFNNKQLALSTKRVICTEIAYVVHEKNPVLQKDAIKIRLPEHCNFLRLFLKFLSLFKIFYISHIFLSLCISFGKLILFSRNLSEYCPEIKLSYDFRIVNCWKQIFSK
jgi:hypothetical protein